ncbi:MAG: GNAT family N-acetyltransferase [Elusimicrobiaceae bacterium]|nr:GNAT family N-acetyltransferase [Elusimicrobiaceae bacterium]
MIYRPATFSDCASLAAIEQRQPRCAQWGEAGWRSEMEVPAAYILCAQEQSVVAGFVALRLAEEVCEIVNVGVLPEYSRRGIASQLLKQALLWVREHGGRQVTLEVGAENIPAVCLYKKIGFVMMGKRKNFYQGREDALVMGQNV